MTYLFSYKSDLKLIIKLLNYKKKKDYFFIKISNLIKYLKKIKTWFISESGNGPSRVFWFDNSIPGTVHLQQNVSPRIGLYGFFASLLLRAG